MVYGGKGLLVANTPWSGTWYTPDAVWMVAHTTQFVQPGWRFASKAGAKLLNDAEGNAATVCICVIAGTCTKTMTNSRFTEYTLSYD